ncbi:MAG TPA: NAD(P)H-dependent oxidoreductase [Candidatus Saccharimonadales bacterium]|nr:NAD(P)H-dependent oxidoreductase [Candidatus Saccharimonadales bacterium]
MNLLKIDSSARRSSVSRQLTHTFVTAWRKENPRGLVVERDLSTATLPLITDEWTQAAFSDPSVWTAGQRSAIAASDELVAELEAADTIVIGVPMYNFAIPSNLKAWIDQIVRVGKTVVFGAEGPQGQLSGRKVVVITSRGGSYAPGTATAQFDHQENYLRHIFGFIGLTDVTFIHAENQMKADLAQPALAAAGEQIRQSVAR